MKFAISMITAVAITFLAGCEAMIRANENMQACDKAAGGTRRSCDELNERRRVDAEFQDRIDQQNAIQADSRNNAVKWYAEMVAARGEDRDAVAARFPHLVSFTGLWCDFSSRNAESIRIEAMNPHNIRIASSSRGPGLDGQIVDFYSSRLVGVRVNDGVLQTTGSPPGSLAITPGGDLNMYGRTLKRCPF